MEHQAPGEAEEGLVLDHVGAPRAVGAGGRKRPMGELAHERHRRPEEALEVEGVESKPFAACFGGVQAIERKALLSPRRRSAQDPGDDDASHPGTMGHRDSTSRRSAEGTTGPGLRHGSKHD